jgi:hypothetical protein
MPREQLERRCKSTAKTIIETEKKSVKSQSKPKQPKEKITCFVCKKNVRDKTWLQGCGCCNQRLYCEDCMSKLHGMGRHFEDCAECYIPLCRRCMYSCNYDEVIKCKECFERTCAVSPRHRDYEVWCGKLFN